MLEAILKEKMLAHLSQFSLTDVATAWFPPPTDQHLLVAEELITKWLDEGNAVDLSRLL